MCSGSRSKVFSTDLAMEAEIPDFSLLLELSASDDITNFKKAVEEEGRDMNEAGLWYGRRTGVKKMGYVERTPLMIAATFGSKKVLSYMLEKGGLDVNRACGSDGATALHCAIAGGSRALLEVVKILLDASADADLVDANGKRAVDLISASKRKMAEHLLGASEFFAQAEEQFLLTPTVSKKEYPVDPSLPDIKNGVYGSDDFRMYVFKVKPCSRAYSHDWTECPFVHPGENARRRDPRKYHYSCVPCPEFRKGTCQRGDACEYAHGIFECWLHPAQYRTRMCKDETSCNRRVCFFAHKTDELRPLYPSTGSAVLSPRSYSTSGLSLDMASITPLALGSPPMSPSAGASSMNGSLWSTPTLQMPISRLKTAINARDVDIDNALLGFESHHLMDDLSALSSPSGWNSHGGMKPTNLEDLFGTLLQSPKGGMQMRQNMNQQLMTSYSSGQSSPSAALSSRSAAFAKRSHSFIDRSATSRVSTPSAMPCNLSGWGSPDGKLDWGIQKEELNKLRKSASFGLRSSGSRYPSGEASILDSSVEPDHVSWVQDSPAGKFSMENQQYHQASSRGSETIPTWVDLYMEQEQIVA